MIGLKDDFYNRYIVKCDLLKPVIDAFVANGLTKYNLFNSAVIELFEFILTVSLPQSQLFMKQLHNNLLHILLLSLDFQSCACGCDVEGRWQLSVHQNVHLYDTS